VKLPLSVGPVDDAKFPREQPHSRREHQRSNQAQHKDGNQPSHPIRLAPFSAAFLGPTA
jgi:hypothetical protein